MVAGGPVGVNRRGPPRRSGNRKRASALAEALEGWLAVETGGYTTQTATPTAWSGNVVRHCIRALLRPLASQK